jgi:hypothetical protein
MESHKGAAMGIAFHDETYADETRARLTAIDERDGAKRLDKPFSFPMPDGSTLEFRAGFTFIVDGHTIVPVTLTAGG